MSEIQILSATHGIAPRSDELLRVGGDVERGRLDKSVYTERIAQETEDWLRLQRDVGIDIQEDGKLAWQDHLRPIVKAATGFSTDVDNAPVTRWLETNTFYRKPTITGWLSLADDLVDSEIEKPSDHISLLAPFSFASLCDNTFEGTTPVENVLGLYSDLVEHLKNKGTTRITLTEVVNQELSEEVASPAYEHVLRLARLNKDIDFAYINSTGEYVNTSYKFPDNVGKHVGILALNLVNTLEPFAKQSKIAGGEIWHSIIDSTNTAEDHIELEQQWVEAIKGARPERVVLTHSTDLQYLPLPYAKEKIKRLGEAKEQLITAIGEIQ